MGLRLVASNDWHFLHAWLADHVVYQMMAREGKMGWNSQKFKENKNKKWVFCVIFILSKVKSNPLEIKSDFFLKKISLKTEVNWGD